jgi:hypothetical protein
MTSTATPRRRAAQKTARPRPEHSRRWLERYGRTLTGDEIQLVQAHRGITEPEQRALRACAAQLVLNRATANSSPTVAHAERVEAREAGRIQLLDRRQFTWEMPGNIAYRRISRDNGDVFITERAPANLHVDVMIDDDPRQAFLWIGVADQSDPPRYNGCYTVIGGDVLRQAAEKIVAASQPAPARRR